MPEASIPSSQLKAHWLPSWSPRMPQLTMSSVYVFSKRERNKKKKEIDNLYSS